LWFARPWAFEFLGGRFFAGGCCCDAFFRPSEAFAAPSAEVTATVSSATLASPSRARESPSRAFSAATLAAAD
jgi:hypothetical protein